MVTVLQGKFNETIDNTIFELIQISGCKSKKELDDAGYRITQISHAGNGSSRFIILTLDKDPIFGYLVYTHSDDIRIKVKRVPLTQLGLRDMIQRGSLSINSVG